MSSSEILVTGYAKLPQGITATELYTVIAVGLIIDKDTGIILDADCSLVTNVAKNFVRKLIMGKSLKDFDEIEKTLAQSYYGSAKKSLISAIKMCYDKYVQIIQNKFKE